MPRGPTSAIFVIALVAAATGCKKDPAKEAEKAIAPHRARAEAHLQSLRALAGKMANAPRVSVDVVTLDAGPVKIGGPDSSDITAGLVSEEDLTNLDSPHTKEKWPSPMANLFGVCGAMLKGGGFVAAHKKGSVAKNCADAKYAVVVRTLTRRAPTLKKEDNKFSGGEQSGEARVWNLETGRDLGGFRFSARNDAMVKSTGTSTITDLERDLAINVDTAIAAGLQRFSR